MKIAIIDNYGSFTYNLNHLVRALGVDVHIWKNDGYAMADLADSDKIIFSPGPGLPADAGLMEATVRAYSGKKPMLGICLGEQAVAEVFGARLLNLGRVYHGVQSDVEILDPSGLFYGLPDRIKAGRYHSWCVDEVCLPAALSVTANSSDGCIMALRHRDYEIYGIQFHPESILTPDGRRIMENFIFH